MFGTLGIAEILVILAVALLVFGPKRLPEVGRTLGRGLREFRKASNELKRSVEDEIRLEEPPAPRAVAAPATAPAGATPRTNPSAPVAEEAAERPGEPASDAPPSQDGEASGDSAPGEGSSGKAASAKNEPAREA